jgi:cytochrome c-type protein NapB
MAQRATILLAASALLLGCSGRGSEMVPVPGDEGGLKSAARVRAERRAYDGAPPVIPHDDFGIDCTECHNAEGLEVPDVGYAPPSPHERTQGMSDRSRCRQCHVFSVTTESFVANEFGGLRQDLRAGLRLHGNAPPTIPHKVLMRENCAACHTGPAAREEIRTTHPERTRCSQCHVPVTTRGLFPPQGAAS